MMLLKSNPFQELLTDFTHKMGVLIEKEVSKNRHQLSLYLTHPRIFKSQVTKLKNDVPQLKYEPNDLHVSIFPYKTIFRLYFHL